MTSLDKYRHLNQDDWKRTQVRMPQEIYNEVSSFAKENNLSLNSAMIVLMDKGLENSDMENPSIRDEIVQMHKEAKEILDKLISLDKKPTM